MVALEKKFGAGRLPIPPDPWFDQPQQNPAVKQGFSEQPITLKTQSMESFLKAPHKLLWGLVRRGGQNVENT